MNNVYIVLWPTEVRLEIYILRNMRYEKTSPSLCEASCIKPLSPS